jgi:hypothetical protein
VQQQDRGIKLELCATRRRGLRRWPDHPGWPNCCSPWCATSPTSPPRSRTGQFDLTDSHGITNAVFEILRNARILRPHVDPNLVVCWGGHSIGREEYEYTKKVGYELGLRGSTSAPAAARAR